MSIPGLKKKSMKQIDFGLQVVALLYYTLSYFPGGVHGLKYVMYSFQSAVMRCFLAIVGR